MYIKNRKIKIAIVGCGRIAQNHINAIQQFPNDLDLVSVCDTNEEALKNIKQKLDIPIYSVLSECLRQSKPDIISLCTPSGLHPVQTVEAAKFGVHVITEKPMATKWQDGLEMVKVCKENNVRLFVVKQNRLNPTIQLLKRCIVDGRFGKINLVCTNVFWTRPQSYYDQCNWRGTWKMDGGALMNQASHYIDLVQWLVGPIESVHAFTGTLARKIEAEDTAIVSVRWRAGTLGSINVTMLTYPKNLEGSITILGKKGTVRIGGVAINEVLQWEFETPDPIDQEIRSASYKTDSVYGFGHVSYYKNVIDVFRDVAEPVTNGEEGLKSLELLIAAYRSARDKRIVSLPLEL